MTQLIISTPPTLFPSELFTHILGYCDDTIEDKQKTRMKKVVNAFKEIFEVRTEEGLPDTISNEAWHDAESKFVPDADIIFELYYILITPCVVMARNQEFKEIRTCTVVNDNCILNSYTKIGTERPMVVHNRPLTTFPPLIYSQCTNY